MVNVVSGCVDMSSALNQGPLKTRSPLTLINRERQSVQPGRESVHLRDRLQKDLGERRQSLPGPYSVHPC